MQCIFSIQNFNPRSHEGSDQTEKSINSIGRFQSTLPRGERRFSLQHNHNAPDFNPRSHEGSDSPDPSRQDLTPISIHAPTRGATQSAVMQSARSLFQSTLPRGERPTLIVLLLSSKGFQSTLPRGERQQFSPKSSLFSQQKLSKIFNLNNKLF